MTTRRNVGKHGPSFSYRHVMDGKADEYKPGEDVQVYTGSEEDHKEYTAWANKLCRVKAEEDGVRGKFVPNKRARNRRQQEPLPERVEGPKPAYREARIRFTGRDGLKVPGYGPGHRSFGSI